MCSADGGMASFISLHSTFNSETLHSSASTRAYKCIN